MTDTPWEPLGPGIYYDVPEDVYHADPCEQPSLSSSLARVIVTESVQHAWHLHPRLGSKKRQTGKAALEGQILHALSLGQPLPDCVVILEHADFRSKAAREARDSAKAAGKTPLSSTEFQRLKTQALELREQQERDAELVAAGMAKGLVPYDGAPEVTIIWTEESFWGPVTCRARLDKLQVHGQPGSTTGATIHDLKRVDSAAPARVEQKIRQYGYHIQAAAYRRAVLSKFPSIPAPDFLLHFVEGAPCYGYTPTRLSPDYLELGERQWLQAVEAWGRGLHTGEWPAYLEPGTVHTVSPRPWQVAEADEDDYDYEQEAAQ